jgi:hypothetical protein
MMGSQVDDALVNQAKTRTQLEAQRWHAEVNRQLKQAVRPW